MDHYTCKVIDTYIEQFCDRNIARIPRKSWKSWQSSQVMPSATSNCCVDACFPLHLPTETTEIIDSGTCLNGNTHFFPVNSW